MDEINQAFESRVDRRQFLRRTAGMGVGLTALPTLIAACGGDDEEAGPAGGGETAAAPRGSVTWISPRGTLEVMDDYNLWVAIKQGYFEDLNLDVELIGGPTEATAVTKFVAEGQADMGYPSPGVLTASIDSGVPVFSIWEQYPAQVFDFAVPADSEITSVQELEGKRISVASAGWKVIIDPLLVEVGVDPESVTLLETGAQWGQIVAQGQADAALTWEGLRAQWEGQGLDLKYFLGSEFSQGPSNVYAVRKADLDDDNLRDVYTRFLQGVVMGFEFAKANPRAAAQLTYREFPALAETLEPQIALESMLQLASGYGATERAGQGWGFHDEEAWSAYLETIAELGQIQEPLAVEDVLTNEFVEPANSGADVERARSDADAFELDEDFAETTVPSDIEL